MTAETAPAYPLSATLAQKIDGILDAHDHDATQIVGILLDVQDIIPEQFVPEAVAFYIAEKLPIKVSIIYDCLTFYSALSDKPRAKYPIQVCRSVVCKVNDSDGLLEILKKYLNIEVGEITYDGRFMIEEVPCFGACDMAPAVRINGEVYGNLYSEENIKALLAKFI
ncbi:MAG: NAD(P)H-dependent oxidoreductase subunit E [Schwartzia sp.]|nr:NAD(P)H-dependent oxidoreductase subunit E [Schwartzia sp. (in: firmicutes)]